MKKSALTLSTLAFVSLGIFLSLAPGCMTEKTSTVTDSTNSTGVVTATTNTVTVVNQAALDVDCVGIQAATGLAVSLALKEDPSAKATLTDVQTAITGVLQGANTNSVSQIAAIMKSSNDTTVVKNLAPIVSELSSLEQSLLAKYGSTVAVQIGVAIGNAINAGITSGFGQ